MGVTMVRAMCCPTVPATVSASRYGQRPGTGDGAGVDGAVVVGVPAGRLGRAAVLWLGLVAPVAGAAVSAGVDPPQQPATSTAPTARLATKQRPDRTAEG